MGASMQGKFVIEQWQPDKLDEPGVDADLDMLADVLYATVHSGASVSFVLPFSVTDARAYWRDKVLPAVMTGTRKLIVARRDHRIIGSVQLDLAVPPNQTHRAEVIKLLVHPDARRLGAARALMTALEDIARRERRTLLTLDTRQGDHAESLYVSMGYILAGVIPGYARPPASPDLEPTAIYYKQLGHRSSLPGRSTRAVQRHSSARTR
jgi:ribosomal protein S18 acetylase RimI-like enzyme